MTANQISLSMCATCAHMGYDHDGPCTVTDQALGAVCPCPEFWPQRDQWEDRLRVLGHEVSISGSVPVRLNRRLPSEFWESLAAGEFATIEVEVEVAGKGFKAERAEGSIVGLTEVRKLRVVGISVDGVRL